MPKNNRQTSFYGRAIKNKLVFKLPETRPTYVKLVIKGVGFKTYLLDIILVFLCKYVIIIDN